MSSSTAAMSSTGMAAIVAMPRYLDVRGHKWAAPGQATRGAAVAAAVVAWLCAREPRLHGSLPHARYGFARSLWFSSLGTHPHL